MEVSDANDVYTFIEEWWGEELGSALTRRIAKAPLDHLLEFEREWPSYKDLDYARAVPTLPLGAVRPIFTLDQTGGQLSRAVGSLLLVQSSIIDSSYIDPFEVFNNRWRGPFFEREIFDGSDGSPDWRAELRKDLPRHLELMASIRPLIKDKSLHVANMRLNLRDTSYFSALSTTIDEIDNELVRQMPPGTWNPDPPDHIDIDDHTVVARRIAVPVELARAGKATIVSGSTFEDEIWRHILSRPITDGRTTRLRKLITLTSPHMATNMTNLVKIRQSEESYAMLRGAIAASLDQVGSISAMESNYRAAAEAFHGNIQDQLAAVERAVNSSSALAAIRDGSTRLTVSIIGLAAGAVAGATGGLLPGLASGAAGATVAGVQRYLQSLAARKKGQLIWDFVMSIRSDLQ